jgi:hypothetical protein
VSPAPSFPEGRAFPTAPRCRGTARAPGPRDPARARGRGGPHVPEQRIAQVEAQVEVGRAGRHLHGEAGFFARRGRRSGGRLLIARCRLPRRSSSARVVESGTTCRRASGAGRRPRGSPPRPRTRRPRRAGPTRGDTAPPDRLGARPRSSCRREDAEEELQRNDAYGVFRWNTTSRGGRLDAVDDARASFLPLAKPSERSRT